MTWTAPPVDRPTGPLSGTDAPMIRGYLAWQRATLLDRCAGLTGEQLAQRSVPPSHLSLLGLLRHLAKVERIWLRQRFAGEAVDPLHDADRKLDTDFEAIDPARAEQDYAALVEEIRLADKAVAGALLDDTVDVDGQTFSLRMIYLHLIGEYARHNGHADLVRERVDGRTGA